MVELPSRGAGPLQEEILVHESAHRCVGVPGFYDAPGGFVFLREPKRKTASAEGARPGTGDERPRDVGGGDGDNDQADDPGEWRESREPLVEGPAQLEAPSCFNAASVSCVSDILRHKPCRGEQALLLIGRRGRTAAPGRDPACRRSVGKLISLCDSLEIRTHRGDGRESSSSRTIDSTITDAACPMAWRVDPLGLDDLVCRLPDLLGSFGFEAQSSWHAPHAGQNSSRWIPPMVRSDHAGKDVSPCSPST